MATLTIRQLDEKTKTRLRVRAAHHGTSMEEEAREILRSALRASPAVTESLSDAMRRRVAACRRLELTLPMRAGIWEVGSWVLRARQRARLPKSLLIGTRWASQ